MELGENDEKKNLQTTLKLKGRFSVKTVPHSEKFVVLMYIYATHAGIFFIFAGYIKHGKGDLH